MDKKHHGEGSQITSEFIKSKFKNQFDLVNHAIKLAENMIVSGRPARVRTDGIGLNATNVVLEEIVQGKDYFEDFGDDQDDEVSESHIHALFVTQEIDMLSSAGSKKDKSHR